MRARMSGSAMAQSADTLLSTEKVMSTPGDRSGLPARCTSLAELSGEKPVYSRWKWPESTFPPSSRPSRPLGLNHVPSGSSPAV